MKMLRCREIIEDSNDNFQIKGKTDDETITGMWAHMEDAHPNIMDNLSDNGRAELNNKMRDILDKQTD